MVQLQGGMPWSSCERMHSVRIHRTACLGHVLAEAEWSSPADNDAAVTLNIDPCTCVQFGQFGAVAKTSGDFFSLTLDAKIKL